MKELQDRFHKINPSLSRKLKPEHFKHGTIWVKKDRHIPLFGLLFSLGITVMHACCVHCDKEIQKGWRIMFKTLAHFLRQSKKQHSWFKHFGTPLAARSFLTRETSTGASQSPRYFRINKRTESMLSRVYTEIGLNWSTWEVLIFENPQSIINTGSREGSHNVSTMSMKIPLRDNPFKNKYLKADVKIIVGRIYVFLGK